MSCLLYVVSLVEILSTLGTLAQALDLVVLFRKLVVVGELFAACYVSLSEYDDMFDALN